jgi:hypothetical protein
MNVALFKKGYMPSPSSISSQTPGLTKTFAQVVATPPPVMVGTPRRPPSVGGAGAAFIQQSSAVHQHEFLFLSRDGSISDVGTKLWRNFRTQPDAGFLALGTPPAARASVVIEPVDKLETSTIRSNAGSRTGFRGVSSGDALCEENCSVGLGARSHARDGI